MESMIISMVAKLISQHLSVISTHILKWLPSMRDVRFQRMLGGLWECADKQRRRMWGLFGLYWHGPVSECIAAVMHKQRKSDFVAANNSQVMLTSILPVARAC